MSNTVTGKKFNFSAIFFQTQPASSLQRMNWQFNWGVKVGHMIKNDSAKDLQIRDKFLTSADFFFKSSFVQVFVQLIKHYKESS